MREELGFGYSMAGLERSTTLPPDMEHRANELDERVGDFYEPGRPQDEYYDPSFMVRILEVLKSLSPDEEAAVREVCGLMENLSEKGHLEKKRILDDIENRFTAFPPTTDTAEFNPVTQDLIRNLSSYMKLSPAVVLKYLNQPDLIEPDLTANGAFLEKGEQLIQREIDGTTFKLLIHYDKLGQSGCDITLARDGKEFDLRSLVPSDTPLFRATRLLVPWPYGAKSRYCRPGLDTKDESNRHKTVFFGGVATNDGLFALMHEIGHVWDEIKNGGRQEAADEYARSQRGQTSDKLSLEVDAQRERSANAWAINAIRGLVEKGVLDEKVYTREFLKDSSETQLFRKHDVEYTDGYHPYLRSKVESVTDENLPSEEQADAA